jgi:hypothetical protein
LAPERGILLTNLQARSCETENTSVFKVLPKPLASYFRMALPACYRRSLSTDMPPFTHLE